MSLPFYERLSLHRFHECPVYLPVFVDAKRLYSTGVRTRLPEQRFNSTFLGWHTVTIGFAPGRIGVV